MKKNDLTVPFTNSLINLEDKKAFFANGYLIVRGAFKNVLEHMYCRCEGVVKEILIELNKEKYPHAEGNQVIYLKGSQVIFKKEKGKEKKSPSILRVVGCGSYDTIFLQFLRSQEIVNAFSLLLSSEKLEHLICQFHPKLPGDEVQFSRHKDITNRVKFDPDWQEVGEECSYAVCIIAIDEITSQNGGLVIEPRSHIETSHAPFLSLYT